MSAQDPAPRTQRPDQVQPAPSARGTSSVVEKQTGVEEASAFQLEDTYPDVLDLLQSFVVGQASDKSLLVVLDTNVLLLPYALEEGGISALESAFRGLADQGRLFVPSRVLREFVRHRDRHLGDLLQALGDKNSRINIPDRAPVTPLLTAVEGTDQMKEAIAQMREGRKKFGEAISRLQTTVSSWRGNDPITNIYLQLFTQNSVIHVPAAPGERAGLLEEWQKRSSSRMPPGYQDKKKPDSGIGDFLIWKSILSLGVREKRSVVFVTGEEKNDWFVRSGNGGVYPRAELVSEYRRASDGANIRLSSLHELLAELSVAPAIVEEVKKAEFTANTAAIAASVTMGLPTVYSRHYSVGAGEINFDYSTNNGMVLVKSASGLEFQVAFSKASDLSIHVYRPSSATLVARVKGTATGDIIDPRQLETSSNSYTVQIGECFVVRKENGEALVGRILELADDTRGAAADAVRFTYAAYPPNTLLEAP